MAVSRVFYQWHIDWYVKLADGVETTHNKWVPECSECSDHCDFNAAYRLNGKPINPRAGRSTYLGEKLDGSD